MQVHIKYKVEKKTVMFGNDKVTIENHIPILSPKEKAKRHRDIETLLFGVLKKYTNNPPENQHITTHKRA